MFYSKWESKDNIKEYLKKVNYKKETKYSGIPLIYEGDDVYITDRNSHSLVVGSVGSGKTQAMILPLIKLSMLAGNSLVVNDPKGELYKKTALEFKNREYSVVALDFDNAKYGNYFNPLGLAYNLYKENEKDKCINIVNEVGYYLFSDANSQIDPFWTNTATDYYSGLCLYLFDRSNREVNLNDVFKLADKLIDKKETKDFLDEIGKDNSIYYLVSGTLLSPDDTKGGIIATFKQKLRNYTAKEKLSDMMSKTDFDLTNIANNKTIIYVISGYYDYSNSLIPLLINQVFEAINIYGNNGRKTDIILDEFDNLLPIKNFADVINYSRSINICFTVVVKSFINLLNTYGKENFEIIKLCFSNIVFLYANDTFTLEEMCKLCGKKSEKELLVSPDELRLMKNFEAIFLIPRVMPFRNQLIPDYEINWNINFKESEFELRK